MYSSGILGRRILEERERLQWSQQEAARLAGVRREMWAKYEAGSEPGAKVLAAMAAAGADVQYILTGQRQGQGIGESAVHQAVLDAVDLLSLEKKIDANQLAKAVVKLVAKSAAPTPAAAQSAKQIFNAPVTGDVAGRDVNKGTKYSVDLGGAQIGQVVQGMSGGVNIVENNAPESKGGRKK